MQIKDWNFMELLVQFQLNDLLIGTSDYAGLRKLAACSFKIRVLYDAKYLALIVV
jgi:hypothetical protein